MIDQIFAQLFQRPQQSVQSQTQDSNMGEAQMGAPQPNQNGGDAQMIQMIFKLLAGG
jgi:hypothetical protein